MSKPPQPPGVRLWVRVLAAVLAAGTCAAADTTYDPFPPLPAERVVAVGIEDFATVPFFDGEPPRLMHMEGEPSSGRLFVADMNGVLHVLDSAPAGERQARPYLDLTAEAWALAVETGFFEQGLQSFTFHPQFGQPGAAGFGRLYTYVDSGNTDPPPDFAPPQRDSHDLLLLEWTAKDPAASVYDGGPPRVLLRVQQPFPNHNAGQIAFNPGAQPGDPDFGMLYVGSADGGAAGDPFDLAQNPQSIFGKVLRIDPLGSDSANGRYGIPPDNPFVGSEDHLPEIYALGMRNPQRFAWDSKTGAMYVADIGQNAVEELSPLTPGANLGWREWEGSFRYLTQGAGRGQVRTEAQRADGALVYPVAEYDHRDPLFQGGVAITGVVPMRGDGLQPLADHILFGDNPSGEVFAVPLEPLPEGGQDAIKRVLFLDGGVDGRTLRELVAEARAAQSLGAPRRVGMRFGTGVDGSVFLLNKQDGTVRRLLPSG